jgi:hypothetical protein
VIAQDSIEPFPHDIGCRRIEPDNRRTIDVFDDRLVDESGTKCLAPSGDSLVGLNTENHHGSLLHVSLREAELMFDGKPVFKHVWRNADYLQTNLTFRTNHVGNTLSS